MPLSQANHVRRDSRFSNPGFSKAPLENSQNEAMRLGEFEENRSAIFPTKEAKELINPRRSEIFVSSRDH